MIKVVQGKFALQFASGVNTALQEGWQREGTVIVTQLRSDAHFVQYTQIMTKD